MFQSVKMMLNLSSTQFCLAKVPVAPSGIQAANTPIKEATLVFSSPQFFVALIAGVLMAFAFQFLLTNFSIAAGISSAENPLDADDDDTETWGEKVRSIESKVGIWTLLTVNIAIFIACFLAVKLTLISSVILGAITGVVIWSAYFLLLLWVSSTAVGSLVGSVVNTAGSGMQGVMATASTALGGSAINRQIVSTAEASAAAVRRELSSSLDPDSLRETIKDYFTDLQLPKLDINKVRSDLEKLLSDVDVKSIAGNDVLRNVNRQTFVDLVSSRSDFSKQDVNRIAEQLEVVWQKVLGQQQGTEKPTETDPQVELLNFLKQAAPEELKSNELSAKLSQLVGVGQGKSERSHGNGLMEHSMQLGVTALLGEVMKRTDLSDLDVEKISSQLQHLKEQATEQAKTVGTKVADKVPAPSFSTIKADVENYLLNSKPWHLNRATIKQEFREVIYDSDAAPGKVRQQIEQLNRDYFVRVLEARGTFTSEQVADIAEQMDSIRQEVFETVQGAESQEQSQDLRDRVEHYLHSTGKEELNPEGIERDFKALLEDPDAGIDALSDRLSQFDRDTLVQLLSQREDLSQEEADQLIGQLESTRDRVLSQAQELQDRAKSEAEGLWQRVESYLRDTHKEELNPEDIKRELQTLLNDPQAGLAALRTRLSHFDRDTLVQLLKGRGDLGEEQIDGTIHQIESVRETILHAPQQLAGQAKDRYDQVTNQIAEYLRNTNLEELDPQGIQQDLAKLLNDPKEGSLALRERLSHVDRETLVKLLSQREDLSEEQVNRAIDRVQEAIHSIVKAPRRLATRARDTVRNFQTDLEDYLRNTDKEELNPEGIKRELQLMLNDPQAGWKNIRDRFSHFDRSTFVALLSQREDISEEEANRIVDQIESVRHQFVEQAQNAQHKVQSVLDGVFGKIRNYFNSLERPELNYEGIKRDFRKLFDDPQAGFDAMRDRLSQFDRDTLVALLSSREDISEADANRLIDQIEGVRESTIHRAERFQQETKRRIKDLKHKAKQQAEETRKSAATAAWWLFGTALTSVATAAIAGVIAVSGFAFFS
ncbi:MFS transporter [Trichocoleus sp. Lan]|uniref:MFS transporter n=1 Tax=Trichocoleus sp. Lan TaxID=2933927 RepID=UPI0032991E9E